MKKKVTILQPIDPLQFNGQFGSSEDERPAFNIYDHYRPMIEQFSQFAIGTYYWFIADTIKGITSHAGGNIDKLCNFTREELVGQPASFLFGHCHPEDGPKMVSYSIHWIKYATTLPVEKRPFVRPSIYIRLMNSRQQYYWAMVQFLAVVMDSDNRPLYSLTITTDISHIKKDGACSMSVFDSTDNSSIHFLCTDDQQVIQAAETIPQLSDREMDVVRLLTLGYASKQIAAELNISIKTVDNHRQRLLKKLAVKSTADVVALAVRSGMV